MSQSHDGEALNDGLVLDLPYAEGLNEAVIRGRSKNSMDALVNTCVWTGPRSTGIYVIFHYGQLRNTDVIQIGEDKDKQLLEPGGEFTIAIWLAPGLDHSADFFRKFQTAVGGYRCYLKASGILGIETIQGVTSQVSETVAGAINVSGSWQLVVITVNDGGLARFFVDGEEIAKGVQASHIAPTVTPGIYTEMGGEYGSGGNFIGATARPKLWTVVKSEMEVKQLYSKERSLLGV